MYMPKLFHTEKIKALAMASNTLTYLGRKIRMALAVNDLAFNLRGFCSPCPSAPPVETKKLFVGGLSWSVDEKSLKDAFSSFGAVTEVTIVYDKDSGRSRGFGFVHFSQANEANSAKDAMDGKEFLGRPLRISFALERIRGGPLVVPRLPNIADSTGRYT